MGYTYLKLDAVHRDQPVRMLIESSFSEFTNGA